MAEFDALFASAVHRVEPIGAIHVRVHLAGLPGLEATVRNLAARETQCCSFFSFATTRVDPDMVTLDIAVPAQYADVLAALAGRASAAAVSRPGEDHAHA